MKKISEAFSNSSIYEKCAFIVQIISSLIVIIFAFLQIFQVWDAAIVVCEIFMGIAMIAQAILQWKKNRGVAIFSLGVAAFIFVVAVIVLFIRF